VVCTVLYAYFIVLSPRLSETHTVCFHFYFLVNRPGMWWRLSLFFSFCLYLVALNVYRASNVCGHVCKSSCLVLQWQSAEVSRKVDEQWVLMVMQRPTITRTELNIVHLQQHYSLFMHNKLQHTWRGDYCECVRHDQLPVLTWGSSSVPHVTTSTIRSPPGQRIIQHNNKIFRPFSDTIKTI